MLTNSIYYQQTTKTTVPAPLTKTGTYSTDGTTVIGDGTLFTTEVTAGDWLYNATGTEVGLIVNITSDTTMTLREAFASNVAAGEAMKIVDRHLPVSVEIDNQGAGNAVVNGATLPAGKSPILFYKSQRHPNTGINGINPIIVDATASTCGITLLMY